MASNFVYPTKPLDQWDFMQGRKLNFDSLAEMFYTRVQENPNKIYVKYYDQNISYAQTNAQANRVANYLKEKGVGKGDIVSIMVRNAPEIYYTTFGTQKLGACAGAVNYSLKGPEIAYVLDDSKPKVCFVHSEFMKDFATGVALAGHKTIVIEVATGEDHGQNIAEQTLADILAKYPDDEALVPQGPEDPALLLYSSGTTGSPKGILLPNRAELAVCKSWISTGICAQDDVCMIIMPMYHTNPLCVWTYPWAYAGQTVCIRKQYSPSDFWPAIIENGVTTAMVVPAMISYVHDSTNPEDIDMSRLKLRTCVCGAAPLPVELIKGVKAKFGVDILEGYGLTEVTGLSTCNPPLGKTKPGSIGPAIPNQPIEIMDDDNNSLPQGERGEICTFGDMNMLGYLNKPEESAKTIKNGWLHTGDVGYMDEDGYIYIVDRKKDMINRGGENIYPREIEIVIEQHPKVLEVAVIGVPDQALGERVKAYIVPREGQTLTEDEMKDYLKERIAKYKIPEFVEVIAQIPRNATGKVQKGVLRENN